MFYFCYNITKKAKLTLVHFNVYYLKIIGAFIMFGFLFIAFLMSLMLFMSSGIVYAAKENTNWIFPNLPEVLLITSGSISLIILLHIIVALSRSFYVLNKIKNKTKSYTKEEFLKFIETQKDVPELDTKNGWLLLGYAIKEYIYKGQVNRKHLSKNLFEERFSAK